MSAAHELIDVYAQHGWRMIAVTPGGKAPLGALGADWPSKASADPQTVGQWFSRWPQINLGIVCDRSFGFVLDVDDPAALEWMPELPVTLTARTPSGGRHFVFRHPEGCDLDNTNSGIIAWLKARGYEPGRRKVDIRGSRGQIVVAPSTRDDLDGAAYRWEDVSTPIADAPRWLLEAIAYQPQIVKGIVAPATTRRDMSAYLRRAVDDERRELEQVAEGSRGHAAFASGAALAELGLSLAETEAELLGACERNGLIAKDGINKVRREIARGWERGAANPRREPAQRHLSIVQAGSAPIEAPPAWDVPHPADTEEGAKGPIDWPLPGRDGRPHMCPENVRAMLAHHGVSLRVNLMSHKVEMNFGGFVDVAERRNNVGLARLRNLARGYGMSAGQSLQDQIDVITADSAYHPVADWIQSKPWDGVDRFDALFTSLTLAPDFVQHAERVKRMLRAWLVTGARAALVPGTASHGVASQGVLVLQGAQGCGKTRWIMSLVPEESGWSKESVMLDPSNRDSIQTATEFWLVELGELDATFNKADVAALKAHITSATDTYRRPYERANETIPRRTFYAATVNARSFLADETGNRRFWVVAVQRANAAHGIDLQQLWAQAAHIARTEPRAHLLSDEDAVAGAQSNSAFESVDPIWELLATTWKADESDQPPEDSWHTLEDIKNGIDQRHGLCGPLGQRRQWTAGDGRALARAVKNRLKAPTRLLHGYTLFAVVRQDGT